MDAKFLYFLSFPEINKYIKPCEYMFKSYGPDSHIVAVSITDLLKVDHYRLFGIAPLIMQKNAKNYAGYPKGNCGKYYSYFHLLFLDDVFEYGTGQRSFSEIRTAEDIHKKLINK